MSLFGEIYKVMEGEGIVKTEIDVEAEKGTAIGFGFTWGASIVTEKR